MSLFACVHGIADERPALVVQLHGEHVKQVILLVSF